MKKKLSPRPPRRRAMGRRVRRIPRPLKYNANRVGGPNTCRVETTIPKVDLLANTPYQFNLAGIVGARAVDIAPNFALYRVAKVLFKYKPNYDTFVSNPGFIGGAGAVSVPTLYWKMNRFADDPNAFTADNLRVMGAKPVRFDDKQVTVSYRPNILVANASGGSISGQVKITPWLNTDDAPDTATFATSTTQHYGHFWYIECAVNGAGTTPVGSLDVTIFYEFKNPRVEWTQSSTQKITLTGGEQQSVTMPAPTGVSSVVTNQGLIE